MTHKIAIIGAGLSGLTAAHVLSDIADVKLFDKSRGVGGRMSTRYAGDYEFDHGAQYFTARDPRFQAAVLNGVKQGVIAPWQGRALYQIGSQRVVDTGGDRFVGTPRMNSWVKTLAAGLDVSLSMRVSNLSKVDGKWTLNFTDGKMQSGFEYVIIAVPSIQAIDILPTTFRGMADIKAVKMDACFALMIGFAQELDFGWDSLRVNDGVNGWLAVNSAKPDRKKALTTLMVHSSPEWSNTYANADKDWVQAQMENSASAVCGFDISKAPHRILHRWLYASVSKSPEQSPLFDPALNIVACGDWCLGGRVEGAYLSGLAAAESIKRNL